jgi:hypothetical protein
MGETRATAKRLVERAHMDLRAHWQGAAVIAALAASDVAYRLLMREQLRRALGMEVKQA